MKKYRFYIFYFLFFIGGSLQAGHNYIDYTTKASQHFSLLNELYSKYPMSESSQKLILIRKLKKKWDNMVSEYKQIHSQKRSRMLLRMKERYIQLYGMLQKTCIKLNQYSNDILIDYTQRLKTKKLNRKQKDIYENSFRVAKHEMYRAQNAYLSEQFNYSAQLYHRSIIILANTYKKLNWAVPPTYEKVQTVSINSIKTPQTIQ